MKVKRLYSVFGKLWDETTETVMLRDAPLAEAKEILKERTTFMRGHGFRVLADKDQADNMPRITIKNPINGRQEAWFWIRETA